MKKGRCLICQELKDLYEYTWICKDCLTKGEDK